MKKPYLIIPLVILAIMPQFAFAQEPLNWKVHGLTGLTVAIAGGIIWVKQNKSWESMHAQIMAFGIYFWVLIFIQAILYGLFYGIVR